MSNSGAFKLITNDGKQDDMLMATRFLNERLYEIQKFKAKDPKVKDPSPTLADIEATHVLFVNAHFKPFVAIGYEYNLVNPTSGGTNLGSEVTFSLPQYGDFFSDMYLTVEFDSITAKNDVDANKYIRWCANPGLRLLSKVRMEVNGNLLDEYDSDILAFKNEFEIQPNKRRGYDRCIGQQEARRANVPSSSGRGGAYTTTDVFNGHQTPKLTHGKLRMNIPLNFWFNKDFRSSIASVSIPYGQRFVKINLANANQLVQHVGATPADDSPGTVPISNQDVTLSKCELSVNNIFVNPEIHDIYIKRIGFNLVRVHKIQKLTINKDSDRILLSQFKWPVETIYFGIRPIENESVLDKKMLDHWGDFSKWTENTLDLSSIDANAWYWDTAGFTAGATTADQYTAGLIRVDGRASTLDFAVALGVAGATVLTVTQVNTALKSGNYRQIAGTFANEAAPTVPELVAALPSSATQAVYEECERTVDTIAVDAQGIDLFKETNSSVFSDYVPFHYGGYNQVTPKDCGKHHIPFCLYPGTYQPSGHINISRAREFHVSYKSSLIDTNYKGSLVCIAIAINFLLISDGSAVLRYAT